MDETLGHYKEDEGLFLERPGLNKFLKSMGDIYEVVIFTAGTQIYADWVLNNLE